MPEPAMPSAGGPSPSIGTGRTADAGVAGHLHLPWRWRRIAAWILGVGGLLAYNWWVLVPLKPGLMTSPSELFSNLEVSGQPYATVMQHLDVVSGVLLIAAFLLLGRGRVADRRRDWLGMLTFAVAGAIGGLFPEVCEDGVSAMCRQQEWHFQLPASQYVHIMAGILEFGAITFALWVAERRTRGSSAPTARLYRRLGQAALVCYPLLGLAYLTNRLGGLMEAVFFVGFTVMVATQLVERTKRDDIDPASLPGPRAAEHDAVSLPHVSV